MKCKYLYDAFEFMQLNDCEREKERSRRMTTIVILVSLLTKVIIAVCGYFLASNHGNAALWSILIVAGLASEVVWVWVLQLVLFASYDDVKQAKEGLVVAENKIQDLEWHLTVRK